MAATQIRDMPGDDFDAIVARAEANRQSVQQYLRQQVAEQATLRTKAEALRSIEENLAEYGPLFSTPDEIVAAIDAGRR